MARVYDVLDCGPRNRFVVRGATGQVLISHNCGGAVFDAAAKFSFELGAGEVIKGWDSGLVGLRVGGTRRLTIPPELAYGKRGSPPDIPPSAALVFEVALLSKK